MCDKQARVRNIRGVHVIVLLSGPAGEARPLLARYPIELFILPLGIAAFYEVKTRGFLPISQKGALDPLVVLAPTLLLFAASFIALRVLLVLEVIA